MWSKLIIDMHCLTIGDFTAPRVDIGLYGNLSNDGEFFFANYIILEGGYEEAKEIWRSDLEANSEFKQDSYNKGGI